MENNHILCTSYTMSSSLNWTLCGTNLRSDYLVSAEMTTCKTGGHFRSLLNVDTSKLVLFVKSLCSLSSKT